MVVWGGVGSATTGGGVYDPAADSWASTHVVGEPGTRIDSSTVWTGTRMLIWSGRILAAPAFSAAYDPAFPGSPGRFTTVTPCRLVDTRRTNGPYGGPALGAGQIRVLSVGAACTLPESAAAVALNVTVTEPSGAGHLRLYPADLPPPETSSINYEAGQTRANNMILPLDPSRHFRVYSGQSSGAVHVILDVTGYFE
jgi:hypothetical protein